MPAAVFLDRDGTLMEEVEFCSDPARVRAIPGAGRALRRLRQRGFLCFIITNQSGIGRRLLTEAQFQAVQMELLQQLGSQEEPVDQQGEQRAQEARLITATYFCPDTPEEASPRRKPAPGMVQEAAQDWGIDLRRSWFIGDKASDIECGHRVGMRTILVKTGYGTREMANPGLLKKPPDFIARDVAEAVGWLLEIV